ncbi:MAG: hypothetical protein LBJ00_13540 [Planctomycetaceae bacterium]|nr:hypothetical protein [Planctomycetaceae bacterium]
MTRLSRILFAGKKSNFRLIFLRDKRDGVYSSCFKIPEAGHASVTT